jgi:hypothetical protein
MHDHADLSGPQRAAVERLLVYLGWEQLTPDIWQAPPIGMLRAGITIDNSIFPDEWNMPE